MAVVTFNEAKNLINGRRTVLAFRKRISLISRAQSASSRSSTVRNASKPLEFGTARSSPSSSTRRLRKANSTSSVPAGRWAEKSRPMSKKNPEAKFVRVGGLRIPVPTAEEEAAIEGAALADPDNRPFTDEQLANLQPLARRRGRPKSSNAKVQVTLRLDRKTIEHFKAGGEGWQTRINDALNAAAGRGVKKKAVKRTIRRRSHRGPARKPLRRSA